MRILRSTTYRAKTPQAQYSSFRCVGHGPCAESGGSSQTIGACPPRSNSQPVSYEHFSGMAQVADAVGLDGFDELANALRTARSGVGGASDAMTRIAHAYLDFARDNRAVYDAMSSRTPPCSSALETRHRRTDGSSLAPNCVKRSRSSLTNRTRSPRCYGPYCTGWSPLGAPAEYSTARLRLGASPTTRQADPPD